MSYDPYAAHRFGASSGYPFVYVYALLILRPPPTIHSGGYPPPQGFYPPGYGVPQQPPPNYYPPYPPTHQVPPYPYPPYSQPPPQYSQPPPSQPLDVSSSQQPQQEQQDPAAPPVQQVPIVNPLHSLSTDDVDVDSRTRISFKNAAAAWRDIDQTKAKLSSNHTVRAKLLRKDDEIEFGLQKAQFRLAMTERRVSVAEADLELLESQIEALERDGNYPESDWRLRDTNYLERTYAI